MFSPLFVPGLNDIVVAVMVFCCRRDGVTSDVVGVGSVGQVPDCAVGVLC